MLVPRCFNLSSFKILDDNVNEASHSFISGTILDGLDQLSAPGGGPFYQV